MNYKCVFADLDRTLLNSSGLISDYTKNIVERLLALGVDFVPCSGRSFCSLPQFLFDIKGIRHGVTSNGVSVDDLHKRKAVETLLIPSDVPVRIMDFLKNEDVCFECFIEGQGYTGKKYYDNPLAFDEKTFKVPYIRSTRVPVENINEFIVEHSDSIGAFDVICHPSEIKRIYSMLKETFSEVYMTNSEVFLIEVSNINCGKHNGLLRYCKLFNVSPEEIIAFGDGNNDVELLEHAGLGVAVSNACENIKKIADRITESNDEDGVAKELERIFFSEQ